MGLLVEKYVDTIAGPLLFNDLDVKEIITDGPNDRTIVTEWRNKNRLEFRREEDGALIVIEPGEIVKRDAHVILLHGVAATVEQESFH